MVKTITIKDNVYKKLMLRKEKMRVLAIYLKL